MFKKFSSEMVTGKSQVKSSVQRGIRSSILEQFPKLEDVMDDIMPKKDAMVVAKCQGHVNCVVVGDEVVFFQMRDGPYFPTLFLLHKYPDMMPMLRVDRGAIKYVFSGANIMAPGLTSAGATIHTDCDIDTPVAIYAEGKEHALAVGITRMSTDDMKKINKGIGVETIHYLNDGLWKAKAKFD